MHFYCVSTSNLCSKGEIPNEVCILEHAVTDLDLYVVLTN